MRARGFLGDEMNASSRGREKKLGWERFKSFMHRGMTPFAKPVPIRYNPRIVSYKLDEEGMKIFNKVVKTAEEEYVKLRALKPIG